MYVVAETYIYRTHTIPHNTIPYHIIHTVPYHTYNSNTISIIENIGHRLITIFDNIDCRNLASGLGTVLYRSVTYRNLAFIAPHRTILP